MPQDIKQSGPKISIVIPARNEQAYLGSCLDALVPQLLEGDEVIVVDNSSKDKTAEIAKSYPGVKVVNEDRVGIAYAQAKGFDEAKNEILARLDADAIPGEDWLSQIKSFFSENPDVSLVCGIGEAYDTGFRKIGRAFMYQGIYGLHSLLVGHRVIWGSNHALKKVVWLEVKAKMSYHSRSWEDFELALHAHRAGINAAYNSKMFILFSQRNGVVSPNLFGSIGYQYRAVGTYWRAGAPLSALLTAFDRTLLLTIGAPFVIILRIRWYIAGRPQP